MEMNQVWPEWHVEETIGQGSYGTVYKCINDNGEYSAVKVISVPQNDLEMKNDDTASMTDTERHTYYKEIIDQFVDEIKILEELKGAPNIVSIEDSKVVEKNDGVGWQIFIRMELLTDFQSYLTNHTMTQEDVMKLGADICNALEVCGKKNIIHRDIKPENIFVDNCDNFKLGDFGVAKQLEKTNASMSIKGTYNYMAPEVISAKKYDTRADIYSLGMVMYKLLNNNRLPFLDTDKQIIKYSERQQAFERRVQGEKIPPIVNIDERTNNIILKACEFKPENRYKSIEEFHKALSDGTTHKKTSVFRFVSNHKLLSAVSVLLAFSIVSVSVVYYFKNKSITDEPKAVFSERPSVKTDISTTPTETTTTTTTTKIDELAKYYKKPKFTFVEPTQNDWYNLGSDENNTYALVYQWPTYGFEDGYDCKKLTSKNIIQSLISWTGYCTTYTQYFEEPIPINYIDSPDPLHKFDNVQDYGPEDSQYYKYPLSNICWLIDNIYNVTPDVVTSFDKDRYDNMPYYHEGAYYFAAPKCGDGGCKKRITNAEKISTGVYRVKIETEISTYTEEETTEYDELAEGGNQSVESENESVEEESTTSRPTQFVVTGEMVVGLKLINEKRYWSLYEFKNLE